MKARVEQIRSHIIRPGNGTILERLAAAGAVAFLIYTLGHGLAFLTQLLIARLLGASSFGVYAYVISWMTVLAYVAALGFNVSLLRFIPSYASGQAWPLMAGVLRYAERRVALAGILIAGLGTSGILYGGADLQPELRRALLAGFFLVPLLALVTIRSSVIRACGGVAAALIPLRVVREGFLLAAVLGVFVLGGRVSGAEGVVFLAVVGAFLGLIIASRSMRILWPEPARRAVAAYNERTWWRATIPLLVVSAVEVLFDRTGVLVLGLYGLSREAGIFALVFNMAMLVILPRVAVDTIFAPTVAALHTEKRHREVQAIILKASALSITGGACIAGTLSILARPILMWFGPEFAAGELPLYFLLVAQLFVAAFGSQLLVLAMTGNEAGAARILVASATANLILCAAAVHALGFIGAALAASAGLVVWNLAMAVAIWRKLQLWPGVLAAFRPEAA